jgi:hypothetical protein
VLQGKGREALQHHGLNLVLLGPGLFLPLVVTAMLSAEVNAYFYTAWMINNIVMFVPVALGTVLHAAGAESPGIILDITVVRVIIGEVFVALRRIERRPERALVPLGVSSLLKIVLATIGARLAVLTGLNIGIVVASYLVAVFQLPAVLKVLGAGDLRRPRTWRDGQEDTV